MKAEIEEVVYMPLWNSPSDLLPPDNTQVDVNVEFEHIGGPMSRELKGSYMHNTKSWHVQGYGYRGYDVIGWKPEEQESIFNRLSDVSV